MVQPGNETMDITYTIVYYVWYTCARQRPWSPAKYEEVTWLAVAVDCYSFVTRGCFGKPVQSDSRNSTGSDSVSVEFPVISHADCRVSTTRRAVEYVGQEGLVKILIR